MKKSVLFLAVSAIVLFGCSNTAQESDLNKSLLLMANNSKNESSESVKESIDGIITQDDMQNDLLSFIANINGTEDTRSINNKFVIELRDKTRLSSDSDDSETRSIDETDEGVSEVFLYDVYNAENDTLGFAITSNDMRIGSVLAVVDDCSVDTDCAQPFLNIFASKLNEYIYEKTYEIESDTRDLSDSKNNPSNKEYDLVSRVENNSYDKAMLSTAWDQWQPYNNKLNGCAAGCVPVALAQIFTQLEYNWYGTYGFDWKAMKAMNNAELLSSEVQDKIALFIAYLGVSMNAKYTTKLTWVDYKDLKKFLEKNKYTYRDHLYDSNIVKTSLSLGIPVFCEGFDAMLYDKGKVQFGGGHAWVIDGYKNFTCTVKDKKTGKESRITDDFVHCNMGWGGKCNGYYRGAVFNVKDIAYSDYKNKYLTGGENTTILWGGKYYERKEGYFRFDVRTISHIVPKYN